MNFLPAPREGSPARMIELTRQYAAQIHANGTDVDTRVSLRKLGIPVLWLFGGKDNEIPTALFVRQLAELIAAGQRNFEQRMLPDAEHAMRRVFREAHPLMRAWMRAHG